MGQRVTTGLVERLTMTSYEEEGFAVHTSVMLAIGRRRILGAGLAVLVGPLSAACAGLPQFGGPAATPLAGRLVAVGIPGAGAISAVGVFHPGGPIRDKPAMAAFTQPGKPLHAERLLVASTANFGAPLARPDQPAGAVLSIDPRASTPLVVPPTFAAAGGQATALDGQVMLYTAQSPAFTNKVFNPTAVTADQPAVANPTSISINNAFGRPWFTNMPGGLKGAGSVTVIDPDGRPLEGAPSKQAGGVFLGNQTDRPGQVIPGSISGGVLGNALMGKSSDGSGRAVFAGLNADGSLVQIHVEKGIDGLAPAGTIKALTDTTPAARAGMAFNWAPDAILFVADPLGNAVVALTLVTDGQVFRVKSSRRLTPAGLDVPLDLAPAVPEVANPAFSSNTTLAGAADLYVANRGNGTVMRLRQDGTVVGVRQIMLPDGSTVGANRLNGIAVAPDASRFWVTLTGPMAGHGGAEGAVLEVPAFGAPGRS
jgi:hypothetical protein